MRVSIRSLMPLLQHLRLVGLDPDAIGAAIGLGSATLANPETRIPHTTALALWQLAGRRSQDDALGIHVAEGIRPGAFDVLDYAARTSATLGDGFLRVVRYHRMLHDGATVALTLGRDRATVTHALPAQAPALPASVAEFVVAAWLAVARQSTGVDLAPIEVRFQRPAPADATEQRRFFRSPIRYEQATNALVLEAHALALPQLAADPGLCAVLDRHLADLHAKLPQMGDLTGRIRHVIADTLASGVPASSVVARALGTSARSLQRHLQREGTSYRALVAALQHELALRYLTERRLALAEVAFLLGFSDPSAFHRAFRRWTGTTPGSYRARPGSETDPAPRRLNEHES